MDLKENLLYIWELFLHKTKIKEQPHLNNGFQEKEPDLGDYVEPMLGSDVSKEKLLNDGQWDKYRDDGEKQNQGNLTMSCVSQSYANCIEQIIRRLMELTDEKSKQIVKILTDYNIIKNGKVNVSKRYIANVSGTTRRGNGLKAVAEAVRKNGLIAEELCPYVNGWNKYYDLNYETIGKDELIKKGKEVAELIAINYEWVRLDQFNDVKVYSPVQTSMYAYDNPVNGIYKRTNKNRNHAVDNDGYLMNQYDKVFDSFEPFGKKMSWDFDFGLGMIFSINLKKNFNYELIKQLKRDGYKIMVRPDAQGQAYVIENFGLIYKDSSKDPVFRNIPLVDYMLKEWDKEGKVHWVSESNYKKLCLN